MKPLKLIMAFIRLGRPHFLFGGLLFHSLGIVMARYSGSSINWRTAALTQAAITATQLMTHYANEYFDLEGDRANRTPTRWSGGSRVLAEGLLAPRVALISALVLGALALAAIAAIGLTIASRPLALPMLAIALLTAWFYSAPPLKLHSRGVGEVAVALLSPGLTPLLGFYMQAGKLALLPGLAVIPLCILQFAMLLAVEFPDAKADAQVGKRTLVVMRGAAKAARLYRRSLIAAYLALLVVLLNGLPPAVAGAGALGMPLAFWLQRQMQRYGWVDAERWERVALGTIALLMLTATAELVAFIILIGPDAFFG